MIWLYWLCAVVSVSPVLGVAGWYLWYYNSKVTTSVNCLPGPKPLPFLGNTWDLLGGFQVLLDVFTEKWLKDHGRLYRVYIGLRPHVVVASADLLEVRFDVVQNKLSILIKVWICRIQLIALNLIEGSKRKRILFQSAFHLNLLDDFLDAINHQSLLLCHKLWNLCREENGCQVDAYSLMSSCALDIVCESAVGCKINCSSRRKEYVQAAHRICQIIPERFCRPLLRNSLIFYLTPLGWEHARCLRTLHTFTNYVVDHGRSMFQKTFRDKKFINLQISLTEWSESSEHRRPFLELVLEAEAAGAPLTEKDVRDEVDYFLFKGHETIASATSWFLYCIARHQDHQKTVREELDAIFGKNNRPCTLNDVDQMNYLECCIKESMRMYPPSPFMTRQTRYPLNIGGYEIPAGCDLLILTYALQRDPGFFPDPEDFRPERFHPENCTGLHPHAYIPFSAEPRDCIGRKSAMFAMTEMKVILSTVLRKFEFMLTPESKKPKPTCQIFLKPDDGINLLISVRDR
nr:CYP4AP10 protein [Diaphanosoma celebensis]